MQRAKPTIADVAKRAAVSVGTVSHVLSDRIKVSGRLRDRVMAAIEELGYVPNFHAQGLRRALSGVIGLCIPHNATVYLNDLSETLEKIATAAGYSLMHVFSRQDPKTEFRRVKDLLRFRIDGLMLFPALGSQAILDFVFENALPTVLFDRSNNDDRFDQVVLDAKKALRETAERLIALGHRRVLFICRSRNFHVSRERIDGLLEVQRESRFPIEIDWIEFGDEEEKLGEQITARLRGAKPPSVIISSNSQQAAAVFGILRDIGARIPEDVSLISFDEPDWAPLVNPPLSVIRQPTEAIARLSFDLLMHRLSGEGGQPRKITLESEIVFRASVGPPGAAMTARRPRRAARGIPA